MIEAAFEAMNDGADAVFTLRSLLMVGHLGLVARHSAWIGGLRAHGKTADEALRLCHGVKRLEVAGPFLARAFDGHGQSRGPVAATGCPPGYNGAAAGPY